ncbi:DedA family protein [Brachybacterium aquaticum]|uniref:Membrane protein DedA with SNARE-associated domain n=1 Tax=Brachybacterium aquaticum TaxID=1432564 RepID=A0A841AAM9_9MICO|nr:DedA family protein [Brachybacterium aquaticum]MBB5830425.1 membrane protein DedA with SNARE-associated domain [Brachybacterium aquaticum]
MNIVDWAVSTMNSLGPLGVFLLIFLENVFPPIPSEVILPLAGVTAAGPDQSYVVMLLASIAGSVVGAWLLYGIGRLLGPERLRVIFIKLPLIHVEDYDKTVAFMDKHGNKAIFFGRMVPGIRSLISIPAGLYAMPLGKFTLLTALGSGIWNTVFVTIGYFMGANWTVIEPYTDIFSKVVYVIIILVVLWFAVKLVLREKKRREMGLPDPDQEYIEELEDEKAHDEKADGDR